MFILETYCANNDILFTNLSETTVLLCYILFHPTVYSISPDPIELVEKISPYSINISHVKGEAEQAVLRIGTIPDTASECIINFRMQSDSAICYTNCTIPSVKGVQKWFMNN